MSDERDSSEACNVGAAAAVTALSGATLRNGKGRYHRPLSQPLPSGARHCSLSLLADREHLADRIAHDWPVWPPRMPPPADGGILPTPASSSSP